MSTPTIIVPGATRQTASALSRLTQGAYSLNSATMAEIHSSLRVTLVVGPSGAVFVRQSLQVAYSSTGLINTVLIGVQVDGTGGWTILGGVNSQVGSSAYARDISGENGLTGLSPGSHTFYMGWAGDGSHQINVPNDAAAAQGTWQSVFALG